MSFLFVTCPITVGFMTATVIVTPLYQYGGVSSTLLANAALMTISCFILMMVLELRCCGGGGDDDEIDGEADAVAAYQKARAKQDYAQL